MKSRSFKTRKRYDRLPTKGGDYKGVPKDSQGKTNDIRVLGKEMEIYHGI